MSKLFTVIVIAFTLVLAGCNTWHGLGKDMEQAGEKIQRSPNN